MTRREELIAEAVLCSQWILDARNESSGAKLREVAVLVRQLSADDQLAVEERLRRDWFWRSANTLGTNAIDSHPDVVVNLMSWHPNGHVRQAAVERLSARSNQSELLFLIMRVADWVEPVRQRAIAAVQKRMVPEYALEFAINLAMLNRQLQRTRGQAKQHAALGEQVQSFLLNDENREALLVAIKSAHVSTRKACLPLLLTSPDSAGALLAHKDLTIRKRTAEALATTDMMNFYIKELLRDKQFAIRAIALEWFRVNRASEAPSALQAALLDKSPSLREYARYHVQKQDPNFDVREFYLEQIQSKHKIASAIAGIGETGRADDVMQLLLQLESTVPRILAATVTAIGRLNGEAFVETLLPYSLHASPMVRRAACEALARQAWQLNVAELCMAFGNHGADVQRSMLRILRALAKWDRLGCGLYAIEHSADSAVRDGAVELVRTWIARNHTEWAYNLPSAQQWARIMSSWVSVKNKLPEQDEAALAEIISELQKLVASRST